MRNALIAGWLVALAFFVWEFINASRIPNIVGSAAPSTIRIVDIAFVVLIVATIYYLAKH